MRQPPRGYPWIERCDIGDRHTLPPPLLFQKKKPNGVLMWLKQTLLLQKKKTNGVLMCLKQTLLL